MANDPLWYEQALLGGLFFAPEKFYELPLNADMFSAPETRQIWRTMEVLAAHGQPIDAITVGGQLETAHQDHPSTYIRDLQQLNVSGANVAAYGKVVQRLYHRRQAKTVAQTLLNSLEQQRNPDTEVISQAVTELLALFTQDQRYECRLPDAISQALEWIEARQQRQGRPEITTGLADLDRALGGWHPGDLVVIAARPAMGKTALGLNFARKAGVPIGLISTEQPAAQIGLRFLAMQSGVSLQSMRTGTLDEAAYSRLTDALPALQEHKVYIVDHPSPNAAEIVAQGRKWRSQYGLRVLIVDYLQRISVSGRQPRNEEVAQTATALKNLARELQITVIALAQLNRNVESRQDKRPQLGDIRDSGMIEQEADQVISLYRDEEYHSDSPDKGIAELDILKNRHGLTGVVKVAWLPDALRFENLAPEDAQ